MDFNRVLGWLVSEAGAGWVFGLISVGVLLFSALRKRAPKIIVRDISMHTLVLVDTRVREKVKVLFRDKPIYKLSQYEAKITNSGREVIKEATIWVVLSGAELIDISLHGDFGEQEASFEYVTTGSAKVHIPYLNPFDPHKHAVRLSLMADGDFGSLQMSGTGEGWSLERRSVDSEIRGRVLLSLLSLLAFFLATIAYVTYIWPIPGPNAHGGQMQWTDGFYLIPIVLLYAVTWFLLERLLQTSSALDALFAGLGRRKPRYQ